MNSDLVVSILENDTMQCIINISTTSGIYTANFQMSEIPSLRSLSIRYLPVLTLLREAVKHLLREWSSVHIELMEDHIGLGAYFTLFANNFDELS